MQKTNFRLQALLFLLSISNIHAGLSQTAITAVTTSYVTASTGNSYSDNGAPSSPIAANTYAYTYGNLSGSSSNDKQLTSLVAGGNTYTFYSISNLSAKMRRVDNAVVTGIRNLKFDEGTIGGSTTVTIVGSYDDDMEHFFIGNTNFNSGSDNIFNNQGDGNGNNNNIERVDVLVPQGFQSTDNSKIGFTLFERGVTGGHDAVKVAAILSLDGAGLPSGYSSVISLTSASYGASDPVAAINYVIARRDNAGETHLKASTSTSQPIGGVFIKFSDFGIANNTLIYGYSVIPNDFSGSTSADIVGYTNSTFYPTTTSGANGGIDLVSFTGIMQNGSFVVLPVTLSFFTAMLNNSTVTLNWQKDNAVNFSHFELQRSTDGKNFNPVTSIYPAAAASQQSFSYTDDISFINNSLVYYRLKMIDKNGIFSFSEIKKLVTKTGNTDISVFPMPAANVMSVMVPQAWQGKPTKYLITDVTGKTILSKSVANTGQTETFDITTLSQGVYFLKVTCGNLTESQKIIKHL
jgi:Secretion system C-terminal sorting domain